MFIRYFIIFLVIIYTVWLPVAALDFDTSVDAEIKKKYDTSKLEYDVLPNLPKTSSPASSVPKSSPVYTEEKPVIIQADIKNSVKIPSGTKFQVKSNQSISDRTKEGSTISFTTTAPVYKKGITIPSGTKIYGTIADSHTPQISGNGGLLVIKITGINYSGKNFTTDGKVTKANYKKVFFNNIKGKRQYLKGVSKQIDKGGMFYKKARNTASKMSDNPILIIFSPISTLVGYVGYAGCTLLSPVTGLSNKGGSISIPAGSQFELKLLKDAFLP